MAEDEEIQEETSEQTEETSKEETLEEREALLDKREELLQREEALAAREKLGGRSEAGEKPKKKVETDEEFTARFEAGEIDLLK